MLIILLVASIILIIFGSFTLKIRDEIPCDPDSSAFGPLVLIFLFGIVVGTLLFRDAVNGRFIADGWYTIHHDISPGSIKGGFWEIFQDGGEENKKQRWLVVEGEDKKAYMLHLEQKIPLPVGTKTVLKSGSHFIPASLPPKL